MPNPSERDSAARKVVAAARAIVTYQIGLPAPQQDIVVAFASRRDLPTEIDEYMNAVVNLPIGSDRLQWDREALRQKGFCPGIHKFEIPRPNLRGVLVPH